ncbi:MAG: hypothetical protein V1720_13875 [bacterium]
MNTHNALDPLDKSNYLKGLLLLIRKDKIVSEEEREIFMRIGNMLGFEKTFLRDSIQNILINEFIIDQPPKFSDKSIAECFLIDAINLPFVDTSPNSLEMGWLKSIATENKINKDWLKAEIKTGKPIKVDESFYKNLNLNKIIQPHKSNMDKP